MAARHHASVKNVLGFRLFDIVLGDNNDAGIDELLDLFLVDELGNGLYALSPIW